jgi:hypothetical protein
MNSTKPAYFKNERVNDAIQQSAKLMCVHCSQWPKNEID